MRRKGNSYEMGLAHLSCPYDGFMMTAQNHTIANYYAREYLNNGVRIGVDRALLLERSGLTETLLDQPLARITPQQLANLMRTVWVQSGDEYMGLVGRPVRHGLFAYLTERLVSCKTLGEALAEVVRFYDLVTDGVGFRIERVKNGRIHFTLLYDPTTCYKEDLLVDFFMLLWHRFPSWLVGQVIPINYIQFPFAEPPHSPEYRFMFPYERRFNQESSSLVFAAKWLDLPVVRTAEQLPDYLAKIPLQWFQKQHYREPITRQVLRLLEQAASYEKTNIDDIAAQLHMTARTLRRRLTAEGSGFQHLKDGLRRDQAINLLADTRYNIAEVGQQMGFAKPASFTRAFKQWTGVSPNRYRQGLHVG